MLVFINLVVSVYLLICSACSFVIVCNAIFKNTFLNIFINSLSQYLCLADKKTVLHLAGTSKSYENYTQLHL